jgi:hypothetical protein
MAGGFEPRPSAGMRRKPEFAHVVECGGYVLHLWRVEGQVARSGGITPVFRRRNARGRSSSMSSMTLPGVRWRVTRQYSCVNSLQPPRSAASSATQL